MAKKRYSAEQNIQLLGEVEIHTSEGMTIGKAARQIEVTEHNLETNSSMERYSRHSRRRRFSLNNGVSTTIPSGLTVL